MRALCRLGEKGAPIKVVNLSLDYRAFHAGGSPACSEREGWFAPLCAPSFDLEALGYPDGLSLHDPVGYDFRRMLATRRSLEAFAEAHPAGAPGGEVVDGFVRYSDGWWIRREGGPSTRPGEPLVFHCRETRERGPHYCEAMHRTADGAQVAYDFTSLPGAIPERARATDRSVAALLEELRSGPDQGDVP
jgi:hypothetical protein